MKKISLIIALIAVSVLVFTSATNAITKKKKAWKGTITYSLSYDGEDITPASVAGAPKSIRMKIMGDKNAVEIVSGFTTLLIVENPEFDLTFQLMDIGDKKYALKRKLSEEKESDSTRKYDVTVDLVNETKLIAGYECKKAVVTYMPRDTAYGEEMIFNFYYSPELGDETTNKGTDYESIPGMLLEFSSIDGGLITNFLATEVKSGGVSDMDFLIPADYKVVTEEELMEEFSE